MSPTANPRHCTRCGGAHRSGSTCGPRSARASFRGSASARGYDRHHQRWRRVILTRDPLCVGWPWGLHRKRLVLATIADHVIPLREWDNPERARRLLALVLSARRIAPGGDLVHELAPARDLLADLPDSPWSEANGQGLCASCHGDKSRSERMTP